MSPLKLGIAATLIALAVGGGATSCPKYTPAGVTPSVKAPAKASAAKVPVVTPSPNAPRMLGSGTDYEDMATGLHVQCNDAGVVTFVSPNTPETRGQALDICIELYNQDQQLQAGLNGIGGGR